MTYQAFKERRFRIVAIDFHFLVDVLNWWRDPPHWLALPINDELPEDCRVITVNLNNERGTLDALVCSMEFPQVASGESFPRLPGVLTEMRTVEMSKETVGDDTGDNC